MPVRSMSRPLAGMMISKENQWYYCAREARSGPAMPRHVNKSSSQPQENSSVGTLNGGDAEKATELAGQFAQGTQHATVYPNGAIQPGLAGIADSDDAPSCSDCGAIMVRNGSCYRCMNCGSTSGCS